MKFLVAVIFCLTQTVALSKTVVIYVNGAFNTSDSEILRNATEFKNKIVEQTGIPSGNFGHIPIAQSDYESVANASCQNTSSGIAQLGLGEPLKYTNDTYSIYYKRLGDQYHSLVTLNCPQVLTTAALINFTKKIYNAINYHISIGDKVILVGHSQGSYYVDGALGLAVKYNGTEILRKLRVVTFGAVSGVNYLNRYTNIEQDEVVYGDKAAAYSGAKYTQKSNHTACIITCTMAANVVDITAATGGKGAHRFADYFSRNLFSLSTKKQIHQEIANQILISYRELAYFDYINTKKPTQIAYYQGNMIVGASFVNRTLNNALAFIGIRDAIAQVLPSLSVYIKSNYTVRVDGTGFDGNEAVTIDGSNCVKSSIVRGAGYFTQQCTSGSIASDSNKVRVYDTQYDLDIEVPTAYQIMSLRGPILAPNAPSLADLGSGSVRVTWGAVAGVTSYEVYRGTTLVRTAALDTLTIIDTGLTAGVSACYTIRAIANGVASQSSSNACITPAALVVKCSGQWTTGQYNLGQTEQQTQACATGYTGNNVLTHTCQAGAAGSTVGAWGVTTTANNCVVVAPVTCLGSWSSTRYGVGQVEEQFANTCPAGTHGQVRTFHTCQASGSWGANAQSDNCTTYLATPTGIAVSSVGGGVQITWGAVSGATSYNIYKNGGIYRSNITGTSYVDTYVTNTVSYNYSVSAYSNLNGQNVTSPNSSTVSVVYRDGQVGVNPPTGVSASQYTQYSQKGIRLAWTGAANAESYLIYRRGYSNPYTSATFLAPVSGGDISFNDWVTPGFVGGVISGQSYCYYIRSVRGGTNSTESNEACSIAP